MLLPYFLSSRSCFSAYFFSYASIVADTLNDESRRKIAGWTIMFTCAGVFLLTYAASNLALPRWV